jgi:hypothetical protein
MGVVIEICVKYPGGPTLMEVTDILYTLYIYICMHSMHIEPSLSILYDIYIYPVNILTPAYCKAAALDQRPLHVNRH